MIINDLAIASHQQSSSTTGRVDEQREEIQGSSKDLEAVLNAMAAKRDHNAAGV